MIGYTIKEGFQQMTTAIGRVEGLISTLSAAMAEKASRAELDLLETRIVHFERNELADRATVSDYKDWRSVVSAKVESHEVTLQRSDAVRANFKSTWAMVMGAAAFFASMFPLAKAISS